jgi:hypothetical protein
MEGTEMRLRASCLLSLSLLIASNGRGEPAKPTTDVRSIVALAHSVDAEFGADALLRLVENGVVADSFSQRAMLEAAFSLAAGAQEQLALKVAVPGAALTTDLNAVFRKGIDSASLRARVVRQLLRTDSSYAQRLYETMDAPAASALTCKDRLIPDYNLYYEVMGEVADAIPNQQERGSFLVRRCSRLRRIGEIAPCIRSIVTRASKLEPPALSTVGQHISDRLGAVQQDCRTFSSEAPLVVESLAQLARVLSAGGGIEVSRAARTWLMRSAPLGTCQGARAPAGLSELFNTELAPWLGKGERLRTDDHLTPLAQNPPLEAYSAREQRYARMEYLLASDSGVDDASERRWKREMQACVFALERWERGDQPAAQYYLEKADLLQQALILQRSDLPLQANGHPKSESADLDAANVLLALLDGDLAREIYHERHAVWFAPVSSMLKSAGHDAAMDDLLMNAQSPVLRLYGNI